MRRNSFPDVEIDVRTGTQPERAGLDPDRVFRALILGDFTGRANRGIVEPLEARRPIAVDRDNLDDVLDALNPALELPAAGTESASVAVTFRNLDDFHPGAIFDSLGLFHALRDMRQALSDRSTFAAAAASLVPQAPAATTPPPPAAAVSLDDLLNGPASPACESMARRAVDNWDKLIREIVSPHLVPGEDPRQAELIAHVDTAVADQMRALLHHPAFQELEAAWRALRYLVDRVETGTTLKLFILDVSREELARDLENAKENLRSSGAWTILVGSRRDNPWSVVAGHYSFDQTEAALQMLARLGAVAADGNMSFLAAAAPGMLEHLAKGPLQQLRLLPQARSLGLAMPRWILRLPYGKETSPVESFAFEEMPHHEHDSYLWANPALACVCLLAQAFEREAWEMRPGAVRDLENLPLHIYKENGEAKTKPCAEVLMTEEIAETLVENGLMPLVSFKDRDVVRLLRFQSIANPPAPLTGPWQ